MASGAETEINLYELPIQELLVLNDKAKQKGESIRTAIRKLKEINSRFASAKACLVECSPKNKDATTLVPLTESLYVPGKLIDPSKVTDSSQADKYFARRMNYINDQIETLSENIRKSFELFKATTAIIEMKVAEHNKQAK